MRATTTRGVLGEMLLPIFRWPMRSPWRLGGVLVGLLALLILIGRVGGDSFPAAGPASPAAPIATTVSSPAAGAASPTAAPISSVVVAPSRAAATQVAQSFVSAWAHPERSTAAWWDGLRSQPLSESFAQSLSSTDPRTVPATQVSGSPTLVAATSTDAQVRVPTDGPPVVVALAREGDAWVVANLLPAE